MSLGEFGVEPGSKDDVIGMQVEIANLRRDLDEARRRQVEHETCADEWTKTLLEVATRENELHEAKDAKIALLRVVAQAARDFVTQQQAIEQTDAYRGVWIAAGLHGYIYTGETWVRTRAKLLEALAALRVED